MKDVTLSVRIDPEIARLFRLLAKQRCVSLSDLMRDAIKDAIFDHDAEPRRVAPWQPLTNTVTVASGAGVIWLDPLKRVA